MAGEREGAGERRTTRVTVLGGEEAVVEIRDLSKSEGVHVGEREVTLESNGRGEGEEGGKYEGCDSDEGAISFLLSLCACVRMCFLMCGVVSKTSSPGGAGRGRSPCRTSGRSWDLTTTQTTKCSGGQS